MTLKLSTYKNTTELATLNGIPLYMADMVDAALRGKLNMFLQGDTGSGKTQLMRDVRQYFDDKSLFILARSDMDIKELFQQVNPEFLRALREGRDTGNARFKELTDKMQCHFIGVDELTNCVPSVRAQLFNLFDGFIEVDGKAYPLGSGYCVGMATGNVGQQFTESSNELGRAIKDRMHVIMDTDHFRPQPIDTHDMLVQDRNPRVHFGETQLEDMVEQFMQAHQQLQAREVPFEKYIIAGYLVHGLDYIHGNKSKIGLKSGWPNKLTGHEAGSDAALVLPVSERAAKSIITLSQALDDITKEKGAKTIDPFDSMMVAFKFVGAYSGILNEAKVREAHEENKYKAMDAVIATTRQQFEQMKENIGAGIYMAAQGKKETKVLDTFTQRWLFMRSLLENLADRVKHNETPQ